MTGILTATYQDTYPPRYILSVTGATGSFKDIYRVVGSTRTSVRGAVSFLTATLIVVDAEIPFGVPFSYQLTEDQVVVSTAGPYTVALPGGLVALSDSITGAAAEVTISAADSRESQANVSVFNIDGKNRVVSGKTGQFRTTYEYLTFTTSAAANLETLLKTCTQGIVQQRQPGGYDRVDDYLAVLAYREERFSQDGSDQRRYWSIDVAQSDGWSLYLAAKGFSYQDVANTYTGLSYAAWAADYATYLAAATGDYS